MILEIGQNICVDILNSDTVLRYVPCQTLFVDPVAQALNMRLEGKKRTLRVPMKLRAMTNALLNGCSLPFGGHWLGGGRGKI